jgi:hypothetical protein
MEKLDQLDLLEIKALCKKYDISVVGDKKSLIKNLKYYLDPVEGTVNVHTNKNGLKKNVGVKVNEKEKLNLILKNKGVFLYYSFGFQYYSVSKDLEV